MSKKLNLYDFLLLCFFLLPFAIVFVLPSFSFFKNCEKTFSGAKRHKKLSWAISLLEFLVCWLRSRILPSVRSFFRISFLVAMKEKDERRFMTYRMSGRILKLPNKTFRRFLLVRSSFVLCWRFVMQRWSRTKLTVCAMKRVWSLILISLNFNPRF